MEFEWDEAKNSANSAKHGVDFDAAIEVFGGPYVLREDTGRGYGERR